MATITKPMALDESFNTTESTSRNQADVLAGIESAIRQGFGQVASAVEYDNTDSGLTADNVQDAIDELAEDKADTSEVTEVDTTNTTPFLYRRTPYNADRVFLDELVGCSFVVNQLVHPSNVVPTKTDGGVTFTNNGDGTITLSGTANETKSVVLTGQLPFIAEHKYYLGRSNGTLVIFDAYSADGTTTTETIVKWNRASSNAYIYCDIVSGTTYSGKVVLQLIDLTVWFGSSIADNAYAKEVAQAGSGIQWLLDNGHDFSKYIAYNTGTLESVNPSGKKVVGFNQNDEVYENGLLRIANGSEVSGIGIRSKNYNACIGGENYYLYKAEMSASKPLYIFWFDENKAFISNDYNLSAGVVTSPSNARFFRLRADGETTSVIICINISKPTGTPKNGDYLPYESETYSISQSPLRGVPTLSNDAIVYDGDVRKSNGDVTRKYGIVDLGDLSWVYYSSSWIGAHFYAVFNGIKYAGDYSTTVYPIVCSKYKAAARNLESFLDKCIVIDGDAAPTQIQIKDTNYTDATTFKTAMSGVYLVYELATPTTEQLTPYTECQICYPDGTEEFIDNREVPIPVGHNSRYADLPAIMDGDYLSYMVGEIEKCAVDAEFMQFTDGTDTFTDVNLSLDASLHTVSVVGSKIEQKRFICFEVMDKMGGVLQGILASCIAFTDGAKTPSGTAFRAYIESLQMYVNFRIYGSGGSYTLAYQSETSFSASAFYVRVRMMNNL